ncbi:hypothetical protein FRC16_011321 [Serendipita sp. 398]|nr:hypothetical protein FRC16_011321 [Serendipita sp. 398]
MTSESRDWSNLRLSLEKPYKDTNGVPLKKLLDVSSEEEFIYEQPKSIDELLGTRLQRVFEERGNTVWDEYTPDWAENESNTPVVNDEVEEDEDEDEEDEGEQTERKKKPMNVEELAKLRTDVVPKLMQALNELMISRDVLGVYLKTALPDVPSEGITPELNILPSNALASTTVTKHPVSASVQAFNAQLAVGGKDEALRKSAAAFKTAAVSMRRALASGERYWTDAIKARNTNWSIMPAPLQYDRMTRRSTDTNAMDVCISYGLEHSPTETRANSIVWLNTEDGKGPLARSGQPYRLCVSLTIENDDGSKTVSRSSFVPKDNQDEKVEDVLEELQRETIDREIFAEIVNNVPGLILAPAWVREQTVSVEISQDVVLRLELIPEADLEPSPLAGSDPAINAICDAIYHSMRLILLRLHAYNIEFHHPSNKGKSFAMERPRPLAGVVELVLYYMFVRKIEKHLNELVEGLRKAGVEMFLRINRLGETAGELIALLAASYSADEQKKKTIGGEILLRIANLQTFRFTMQAPALLTAILAQSISVIHSMGQFDELLRHEVTRCILQRIYDLGRDKTQGPVKEAWFMDVVAGTCFSSWEGTTLRFQVSYVDNWSLKCSAELWKGKESTQKQFPFGDALIFDWAASIVADAFDT